MNTAGDNTKHWGNTIYIQEYWGKPGYRPNFDLPKRAAHAMHIHQGGGDNPRSKESQTKETRALFHGLPRCTNIYTPMQRNIVASQ